MNINAENAVRLTPVDRIVLESYKNLCEGLSDYLGDCYEIVLHSLEDFNKSVVKIINGRYTGRKEGSPITDLALRMLENPKSDERSGYISYFSKNKKGAPMRSCTILVRGEKGRAIGFLCVNLYMDAPLRRFVGNLFEEKPNAEIGNGIENFADNPLDLISNAVAQVRGDVLSDVNITAQNRNKEIVGRLTALGVFKLKDSVSVCAKLLGLSKNTVYMHLRNVGG